MALDSLRRRCLATALLVGCAGQAAVPPPAGAPASLADLCVTEGRLEDTGDGRLRVGVPKMRAVFKGAATDTAELRFTYLGASESELPLESGATRVQFGLKLRAADPCSLVYVMWRVEPQPQLVVSVKSNPEEHLSSACGNRGYRNLRPRSSAPLPILRSGAPHTLSARLQGATLAVSADGRQVWEGPLERSGAILTGPVGVRSDNARLEFALLPGAPIAGAPVTVCRSPETMG